MEKLRNTLASKKSILILTISAALFIAAIQTTDIIAQETSEKKYPSADDVEITAVFDFYEGQEVATFEVFRQVAGFDKEKESPQFILEKIVGNTPMLHKAADETYKMTQVSVQYDWKYFDVNVIISKEGEHLRAFDYRRCQITDYDVWTYRDPAESWTTSQGFATADLFEFACEGYKPISPAYEKMTSSEKADTISSKDLVTHNLFANP